MRHLYETDYLVVLGKRKQKMLLLQKMCRQRKNMTLLAAAAAVTPTRDALSSLQMADDLARVESLVWIS